MIDTLKQESDLYTQVWSLVYQSNRRWDVYLRNNIRVQLPEADSGNAWSRLAEMDRERQLTRSNITNIDLRILKTWIRSSLLARKEQYMTTEHRKAVLLKPSRQRSKSDRRAGYRHQ